MTELENKLERLIIKYCTDKGCRIYLNMNEVRDLQRAGVLTLDPREDFLRFRGHIVYPVAHVQHTAFIGAIL